MPTLPTYVLVTPARDEAQFIELAIKSVVAQTVRPQKWVIVSDGSTDGTDAIVGRYAAQCPWIELIRMPEHGERDFASKIHAFNAGYARVKDLKYEVIGCLDGDVSFDEEYFSFLLRKLAEDPTLGVAGTAFKYGTRQVYDYRFVSTAHVSGPCQLFRRKCFEEIGGYVSVKTGGIDVISVTAARMRGWNTRTFEERSYQLHRQMGMALGLLTGSRFRQGIKDYALGNHPTWELFRVAYQMTQRPFVIGGSALGCGYLWALARRSERVVSPDMMAFRRRDEMQRLGTFLAGNTASRKGALRPSSRKAPGVSVTRS